MKATIDRRSATMNLAWLDTQNFSCRRYAREQGLTSSGSFFDIGLTGHGFDQLIGAAERGETHAVIVNDFARLRTRVADQLWTVQRLHDAGVTILVTKEGPWKHPWRQGFDPASAVCTTHPGADA